jgi:hypothetical protein
MPEALERMGFIDMELYKSWDGMPFFVMQPSVISPINPELTKLRFSFLSSSSFSLSEAAGNRVDIIPLRQKYLSPARMMICQIGRSRYMIQVKSMQILFVRIPLNHHPVRIQLCKSGIHSYIRIIVETGTPGVS